MPAFATEGARKSQLVKKELWPETAYNYEVVTFNQADAADLVVGTALGRVSATGVYQVALETGSATGINTIAALVVEEVSAPAATDTKVLVMRRGPAIVSKFGIVLDASYDNATKVAAAYADLEAKGILVNDSI